MEMKEFLESLDKTTLVLLVDEFKEIEKSVAPATKTLSLVMKKYWNTAHPSYSWNDTYYQLKDALRNEIQERAIKEWRK